MRRFAEFHFSAKQTVLIEKIQMIAVTADSHANANVPVVRTALLRAALNQQISVGGKHSVQVRFVVIALIIGQGKAGQRNRLVCQVVQLHPVASGATGTDHRFVVPRGDFRKYDSLLGRINRLVVLSCRDIGKRRVDRRAVFLHRRGFSAESVRAVRLPRVGNIPHKLRNGHFLQELHLGVLKPKVLSRLFQGKAETDRSSLIRQQIRFPILHCKQQQKPAGLQRNIRQDICFFCFLNIVGNAIAQQRNRRAADILQFDPIRRAELVIPIAFSVARNDLVDYNRRRSCGGSRTAQIAADRRDAQNHRQQR